MKKITTLLSMIAFVVCLTGCSGEQAQMTQYEQAKIEYATQVAATKFVPYLASVVGTQDAEMIAEYTPEEVEVLTGQQQELNVDGYGMKAALISFESGLEAIGEITAIGEVSAVIDHKEIIVDVNVEGTKKNAVAQLILTNDMFMKMKSAALNPIDTFEESMAKAGMNTLIGMGSVFAVLILISLIISCLGLLSGTGKKQKPAPVAKPAAPSAAPVAAPVVSAQPNLASDLELAAVIAAAIAAYEGATSTDGFVVRSIRKRAF